MIPIDMFPTDDHDVQAREHVRTRTRYRSFVIDLQRADVHGLHCVVVYLHSRANDLGLAFLLF